MTRDGPLVSVCMPAYNAERWIAASIESVLNQTFGDFELVISNNASTDATMEIASSFGDPRITIDSTSRLIAPVLNHNRSVALARTRFIKFLHADDLLLPTCLEEMLALANDDPDVGLVFAGREVLLDDPNSPDDVEWSKTYARLQDHFAELERINDGRVLFRQMLDAGIEQNWVGEPSAVLVTRDSLTRVGLFNPQMPQIADLDLWLRIMLGKRVGYIPHVLSVYRHHSQSGTAQNARLGRDWLDRLWLLEGLLADSRLKADERARVLQLRNAALRRATLSQVRRLVHRKYSPNLLSYWTYRVRALGGNVPRPESLEPLPDEAPPHGSPATVDHARR
jgi:glycosyltransferase involved in cell wall biosynthesis